MKQTRPYARVTVTPKGERWSEGGHPWIYDTDVEKVEGTMEDGGLADVVTEKGRYVGTGFYNARSKIRVRIFSRNANDRFDDAFFVRRFRYAWEYRKAVLRPQDLTCCRVIFGESDAFPGLTVDRFGGMLVTQTLSLGMELRKERLFPLLCRVLREDGQEIEAVYERNDVSIREREGMNENKGFFPGWEGTGATVVTIVENGVTYAVDVENGQKTGFFLDQKYNREAVARLARGRRVLDCFTHTGSFALNAVRGGADRVCAVDISETAVEQARANARLNGWEERMEFRTANVFDWLPQLEAAGDKPFDFIILDPPAFTKSRRTVDSAARGYKEINRRAMRLLPRGGYLATCSCSHFMTEDRFIAMLRAAAADAGVQLRQIEARQQSPDHPILWNAPETNYLKFYLFQVV